MSRGRLVRTTEVPAVLPQEMKSWLMLKADARRVRAAVAAASKSFLPGSGEKVSKIV